MVTHQSTQGHSGLTHPFNFFDTQSWAPECPNVKKLKRVG